MKPDLARQSFTSCWEIDAHKRHRQLVLAPWKSEGSATNRSCSGPDQWLFGGSRATAVHIVNRRPLRPSSRFARLIERRDRLTSEKRWMKDW